jgi:hypothetical protein
VPTADVARWRAFAGVTALLTAVILLGWAAEVDTDHLWILVGLAAGAAVSRAVGCGGPRSIVALTALVLLSQPALHAIGEAGQGDRSPVLAHTGLTGLLLLVGHIVLAAALVGGLAAVETLARRLAATVSRWTRVMVWSIPSTPVPGAATVAALVPDLSHARHRAPRPPRRGPPS